MRWSILSASSDSPDAVELTSKSKVDWLFDRLEEINSEPSVTNL
jgi:hypothetical protein